MEREGEAGLGRSGRYPSLPFLFPPFSPPPPPQQILMEQNVAEVHQDEPCSCSGEEQRLR